MNRRLFSGLITAVAIVSTLALTGQGASQTPEPAASLPVVAHEWGTFTSIAAANGSAANWQTLGGPQDLPCFVGGYPAEVKIGWMGTVRMETPVIYFYAQADTTVRVSVKFRQGLITETYPSGTLPPLPYASAVMGGIDWPVVRITPGAVEHFPFAQPASSHYYAARATDASPVEVNGQQEKFLFYRGVAGFQPPISATVSPDGRVTVKAIGSGPLGDVIVFQNRGGEMAYQVKSISGPTGTFERFAHNGEAIAPLDELERLLVAQGLFAKEAKAMVATWRDSWFEEGTRLFYIAPKPFVDETLPLAITPAPATVTRVFVGRVELVTPDREAAVRAALERRDTATLLKFGRFLQPISDRILVTMTESARKPLLDALGSVNAASPATPAPRCQATN